MVKLTVSAGKVFFPTTEKMFSEAMCLDYGKEKKEEDRTVENKIEKIRGKENTDPPKW